MPNNHSKTVVIGASALLATALSVGTAAPVFAESGANAGASSIAAVSARSGNIQINETTFPDANLRAWMLDAKNLGGIGADGTITPDEAASVTSLSIQYKGVRDFTGIQCFTNLIYLNIEGNYAKSIDISTMPKLVNVYLRNNMLESIDFTNNTALEFIEIFDNQLTEIDVSMLPNLRFLHVDYNNLEVLDLSQNTKLEMDGFVLNNNRPIQELILPEIRDSKDPEKYARWRTFVISEQDPIEGYADVKWYADEKRTEEIQVGLDENGDEIYRDFNGQTLYAKRIPNPYTVNYRAGGGTGTLPEATKTVWKEEFPLPETNGLSRTGYTFAGWQLPSGEVKQSGEKVSNLAGKDTNSTTATVTATWNPITYTVKFTDAKRPNSSQTVTATYDQSITLPAAPEPVEGYIFTGWELPNKTVAAPGTTVKNLTSAQSDDPVTVTAQWKVDEVAKLREQLKAELDTSNEAIQDSGDYFVGVKNAASNISTAGAEAIEQAQASENVAAAYQQYAQQLAELPRKSQTLDELDANLAEEPGLPTSFTDLTSANRTDAGTSADSWSANSLDTTLSSFVAEELPGSSATRAGVAISYTNEDRSEAVTWLKSNSSTVTRETSYASSLTAAFEVFDNQQALTSKDMANVKATDVNSYEDATDTVAGLADHSMLKSHLEALTTRLDLSKGKQQAQQRVQSEFDSLTQFGTDYSEERKAELRKKLDEALAAIDNASSTETVDDLRDTAVSDLDAVPTIAQELAQAKNDAAAQLRALFTEHYREEDYSPENWAAISAALDAAIDSIESAESITEVPSVEDVTNTIWPELDQKMTDTPTIAEEAAAELAAAKKQAESYLREHFAASYAKADYSASNWAKLDELLEATCARVQAATSLDEVSDPAALWTNLDRELSAVPTLADEADAALAQAKADALTQLDQAYDALSTNKSRYSASNWKRIVDLYETAKLNVRQSDDIDRIAEIAQKAIDAMNAVEQDAEPAKPQPEQPHSNPSSNENTDKGDSGNNTGGNDLPATGDPSAVAPALGALGAALTGMAARLRRRKRS